MALSWDELKHVIAPTTLGGATASQGVRRCHPHTRPDDLAHGRGEATPRVWGEGGPQVYIYTVHTPAEAPSPSSQSHRTCKRAAVFSAICLALTSL
jgi:hypothetical protein